MARYAIINEKTNKIVNVAEWDGIAPWKPPVGHYVASDERAGIDDSHDPVAKKFIYLDRTQKD